MHDLNGGVPANELFWTVELPWVATDSPAELGEGASVPPTDPAAFLGSFAAARAEGSFSASEIGFSFESNRDVSSELGYAELGSERNGVFLT